MITLLYTRHMREDITPRIQEIVRGSEIFFWENYSVTDNKVRDSIEERYNMVSRGEVTAGKAGLNWRLGMSYDNNKGVLEMLHGSGVKVYLERCERSSVGLKGRMLADGYFDENKIDDALRQMRTHLKQHNAIFVEREKNISNSLAAYAGLKKSVTALLGGAHTPVYHELRSRRIDCTQVYPILPFEYDILSEVLRRERFSKEITDRMLLQTVAFGKIALAFLNDFHTIAESDKMADRVARRMDEEDLRNMAKHISENWWRGLPIDIYYDTVRDWLEGNGFIERI